MFFPGVGEFASEKSKLKLKKEFNFPANSPSEEPMREKLESSFVLVTSCLSLDSTLEFAVNSSEWKHA